MCFDLKSDPVYYFNLSIRELKKELDKKPKVIRTIKHKKHPIIMNPSYGMNFDNYKQLGIKKLRERAKLVRENKELFNSNYTNNDIKQKIFDIETKSLTDILTNIVNSY